MAADRRGPSIPLPEDRPAPSAGSSESTTRGPIDGGRAIVPEQTRAPRGSVTIALVALVVGVVIGAAGWAVFGSDDDGDPFGGAIDTTRYQAVILTNDKVYFGRVEDVSDTFLRLDDAFFLRETRESADAEPVRTLLPINRELQAPENRMLIRKDEIVLVENLAADSPVLKEIKRQKGGK
jgi:hypothetical protein